MVRAGRSEAEQSSAEWLLGSSGERTCNAGFSPAGYDLTSIRRMKVNCSRQTDKNKQ